MRRSLFDMSDYELDMSYERYVDRLLDQAYGDRGECCKNCRHFCRATKRDPKNYCEKYDSSGYEYYEETDPDDCCDDYEYNVSLDTPDWEEY